MGGVANGISPRDKYNHCGGEGPDRTTSGNDFRLAAFAFSQSQTLTLAAISRLFVIGRQSVHKVKK